MTNQVATHVHHERVAHGAVVDKAGSGAPISRIQRQSAPPHHNSDEGALITRGCRAQAEATTPPAGTATPAASTSKGDAAGRGQQAPRRREDEGKENESDARDGQEAGTRANEHDGGPNDDAQLRWHNPRAMY